MIPCSGLLIVWLSWQIAGTNFFPNSRPLQHSRLKSFLPLTLSGTYIGRSQPETTIDIAILLSYARRFNIFFWQNHFHKMQPIWKCLSTAVLLSFASEHSNTWPACDIKHYCLHSQMLSALPVYSVGKKKKLNRHLECSNMLVSKTCHTVLSGFIGLLIFSLMINIHIAKLTNSRACVLRDVAIAILWNANKFRIHCWSWYRLTVAYFPPLDFISGSSSILAPCGSPQIEPCSGTGRGCGCWWWTY